MKLLLILSICSLGLSAQQVGGVNFHELPFDDLLSQAKKEDKLIFIDAYTTWCGPCKMMDAKVFSDSQVAQAFNERFINAKFDMEKGEGISLGQALLRSRLSYLPVCQWPG